MSDEGSSKRKCVRCASCLDQGEFTSAAFYCIECEIYLCSACLKGHSKFPATKAHQVNNVGGQAVDFDQAVVPNIQHKKDQPVVSCQIHNGKVIGSFCTKHEQLCCEICAVLTHRLCNVEKIAVVAKDFRNNPKLSSFKGSIKSLLADLNHDIEIRMNNINEIEEKKIHMLEKIDKFEENIKKLAETSRKQIRDKCKEQMNDIESDMAILKTSVAVVTECNESLSEENDEQLFTNVETKRLLLRESQEILEEMCSKWRRQEIKFQFDQTVKNYFKGRKTLGTIEETGIIHAYAISNLNKQVCFKRGIHFEYSLFDMCVLESGDILIADHGNASLKRYSSDRSQKEIIDMEECPVAVCCLDASTVAVRTHGDFLVHIISVEESMKKLRSFRVEDGCGMTYDAVSEEFYICEETKVGVYSKAGVKLRTYETSSDGEMLFSKCFKILLDSERRSIFVTDLEKGLFVLTKSGNLRFRHSSIKSVGALCRLPGHIYLVHDASSKGLIQIDRNGHEVGVLLNNVQPYFAVYDQTNNRLYLGGGRTVDMYLTEKILLKH